MKRRVLVHKGFQCTDEHAVEVAHMVSSAEAALHSREHYDWEVLDMLRDYLTGKASADEVIADFHSEWPSAFPGVPAK